MRQRNTHTRARPYTSATFNSARRPARSVSLSSSGHSRPGSRKQRSLLKSRTINMAATPTTAACAIMPNEPPSLPPPAVPPPRSAALPRGERGCQLCCGCCQWALFRRRGIDGFRVIPFLPLSLSRFPRERESAAAAKASLLLDFLAFPCSLLSRDVRRNLSSTAASPVEFELKFKFKSVRLFSGRPAPSPPFAASSSSNPGPAYRRPWPSISSLPSFLPQSAQIRSSRPSPTHSTRSSSGRPSLSDSMLLLTRIPRLLGIFPTYLVTQTHKFKSLHRNS